MTQRPDDQQRRKNLESIRGVLIRLETMADANAAAVEAHAAGQNQPEARTSATVTPLHPGRGEARHSDLKLQAEPGQDVTAGLPRVAEAAASGPGAARQPDQLERFSQIDAETYGRRSPEQAEWALDPERRPPDADSKRAAGRRASMILTSVLTLVAAVGLGAGLYAVGVIQLRGPGDSAVAPTAANDARPRAGTATGPVATVAQAEPAKPAVSAEPQGQPLASGQSAAVPAPAPKPSPAEPAAASPSAAVLTAPAPIPAPRPMARPAPQPDPAPVAAAPERDAEIPVEIRIDPRLVERFADHYITINGLPAGARLSNGRMVFPGSYALEVRELPGLRVILPAGAPTVIDINLVLVGRPGTVLAETTARIGARVDEQSVELSGVRNPRQTVTLALQQIEQGNVAGARELLMQAVEAGDGPAALILGTSFDPRFSFQFGHQDTGDIGAAVRWYRVAAERGSTEAAERLRFLESQQR